MCYFRFSLSNNFEFITSFEEHVIVTFHSQFVPQNQSDVKKTERFLIRLLALEPFVLEGGRSLAKKI